MNIFSESRDNGIPLFGVCLTYKDLRRLKEGEPIKVDLAELGGRGVVAILARRNDQAMLQTLKERSIYDELRRAGGVVIEQEAESGEQTDFHGNDDLITAIIAAGMLVTFIAGFVAGLAV